MERSQEKRRLALEALNHPPPPALFAEPLDYFFAEHFRQRTLCSLLDDLAEHAPPDAETVTAITAFLRGDFGLHVRDEEEDLFPLLRRRARPEDRIGDVLSELSHDHALDAFDAETILQAFGGRGPFPACNLETRNLLMRFSKNERRHLTAENAIILPLARVRLSPEDLRNLGLRMAARHGAPYPEPENAH
ncbi:hemerythrin domain-containing protein [uncultured Roseibium sp.]|uniref:hemerythrin domain-containing protein n=1 Tax=uncultured Roseibium sp. TaxID=1936171 RepID=UPI00321635D8